MALFKGSLYFNLAKSNDEQQFRKSLEHYLPGAWIHKPPDVGGNPLEQGEGRRFEAGRPSDFLVQALTDQGPIFALLECKRFEKKSLNHKDLRSSQILALSGVHKAGGLSLVCFHGLYEDQEDKMYLIPYEDVRVAGLVKVENYVSCVRTRVPTPTLTNMKKTQPGWDLTPLVDIMKVHAVRMRNPKCWKKSS